MSRGAAGRRGAQVENRRTIPFSNTKWSMVVMKIRNHTI